MKKIDWFAWFAEGLVPIVISGFLYIITGASNPFFYFFFAGSIAMGQLLTLIVRVSSNSNNISLISRPDNVVRIFIICIVLIVKFFISDYYIFLWITLNFLIFFIIGKYKGFGRFAYTLSSYYSRLLNFIYLISLTKFSYDSKVFIYLNGFIS